MILLDNTVLSNYALVGQTDLLRRFSRGQALVTDAVLAEFEAEIDQRSVPVTDIMWIRRRVLEGAENGVYSSALGYYLDLANHPVWP